MNGPNGEERRCDEEHQRAANDCAHEWLHSNLEGFWNRCGRLLPVQTRHWESPVIGTHTEVRSTVREKRGSKSSTNVTHFAAVLTVRTCMIAEPYALKHREGNRGAEQNSLKSPAWLSGSITLPAASYTEMTLSLPCEAQKRQNPPREIRDNHTGNVGGNVRFSRAG